MKLQHLKWSLFILLIPILISCEKHERITGNHRQKTETRRISTFEEVQINGDIEVEILHSNTSQINVTAESNIIPFIDTYIKNNTLIIEEADEYRIKNHIPIKVTVYSPILMAVELNGSGSVYTDTYDADDLYVNLKGSGEMDISTNATNVYAIINGSGNIKLHGNANVSDITINGSGNISGYKLHSNQAYIKINGSGKTYITVYDYLDAAINGSGNIIYKGSPNMK